MGYVRTVKTASGAAAVQIVHSNRRGSREIEHIGSAHSPAEVEVLRAAARQRLHAHQDAFDFGDGRPEGQALPITSTQSKHLWDALGWAYDRLGRMWPRAGMRCFVSWCWPGWLSRPASSTRSGCWPSSGSARRGIAPSSAGSRSPWSCMT